LHVSSGDTLQVVLNKVVSSSESSKGMFYILSLPPSAPSLDYGNLTESDEGMQSQLLLHRQTYAASQFSLELFLESRVSFVQERGFSQEEDLDSSLT